MSRLQRFRVDIPVPGAPLHERPFTPRFRGRIMAVDQTLAKSGCALIEVIGDEPAFLDSAMVKSEARGRPDERIDEMIPQFIALMDLWKPDMLAYEMPPANTRHMRSTESSLTAAVVLRTLWRQRGPIEVVLSQSAKYRWTGDRGAEKTAVGAALMERWPEIAALKPCNQDIRDAIALGLVAAEQGGPRG